MPHAVIFGRIKFRVSEVEPWLAAHGYFMRPGVDADTVSTDIERPGGAGTPRARTRGETPHASKKA
jgi:hypothetical protein